MFNLKVGRKIQAASANSNMKRVTLECGGKSPLIVFSDADVEKAAEECATSIFSNQGQVCSGASRAFVHEDVHDKFVDSMKTLAEKRVVGDPFDEKSETGAVISKLQFDKILNYIKLGKAEGAICVTGGEKLGDKGYFIKPTIFTEVEDNMTIAKEEVNQLKIRLDYNNRCLILSLKILKDFWTSVICIQIQRHGRSDPSC